MRSGCRSCVTAGALPPGAVGAALYLVRPGELRALTWANVDWQNGRFVLHRHKTSRTQRVRKPRVIPFPPLVGKLSAGFSGGKPPLPRLTSF